MKVDRLLSIIIYLLNHDLVSARALAERFGVTVRTIQRDIESIELAGIPIVSVQGPHGGYGIMDTFKLDRRLVSVDDLFYIVTALRGIAGSLGDDGVDQTLEKVESLIPGTGGDFFSDRSDRLDIDFSMLGGDPSHQESFRTVRQAVESGRLLRFTYTSNKLETCERTVEPMTVVFRWRAWYLYAWCRLRSDYRLFRISRIRNAEILHEAFERRNKPVARYLEESASLTGGQSVDIALKFHPSMRLMAEETFTAEQREESRDGGLIVHLRMPEDGWLYGFVLSWGQFVEVLSPASVRNAVASAAAHIRDIYE